MKRCTTETCSMTLPLKVEKWQADRLDKRFELGRQLYNTLLNRKMKDYDRLKYSRDYKEISEKMDVLFKEEQKYTPEYRALSKMRTDLLKSAGFTEYGFIGDMRPLYKCFRSNIDSNMAPAIAQDVWRAFQKFLYGNGKVLRYKRAGEVNVLSGQRSRSSIRWYGDRIWFNGLTIPVKIAADNQYEQEMLSRRIKFCRVMRRWIKGRYQYYVQLVLEGIPALKRDKDTGKIRNPLGTGRVGLHVGLRFLTYVSEKGPGTAKLTFSSEFQREKRRLARKMDRSLLAQHPGFRASIGKRRFQRGNLKKSNRYRKLQNQYKELCRRESVFRTYRQNLLANEILMMGNEFYTDKIDYALLARRPEKKGGKKRGSSGCGAFIGENAPASFLRQLDRKIRYRGGQGVKTVPLKTVDPVKNFPEVRMDLYIAFLLQRHGEDFRSLDTHSLMGEYQNFITA